MFSVNKDIIHQNILFLHNGRIRRVNKVKQASILERVKSLRLLIYIGQHIHNNNLHNICFRFNVYQTSAIFEEPLRPKTYFICIHGTFKKKHK